MTVIGLDPTSGPMGGPNAGAKAAPRVKNLDGTVIGLVCNGLGYSEKMMDALATELSKDIKFRGMVKVVKGSVSIPPDPTDWERLINEVTVAVTGFGG